MGYGPSCFPGPDFLFVTFSSLLFLMSSLCHCSVLYSIIISMALVLTHTLYRLQTGSTRESRPTLHGTQNIKRTRHPLHNPIVRTTQTPQILGPIIPPRRPPNNSWFPRHLPSRLQGTRRQGKRQVGTRVDTNARDDENPSSDSGEGDGHVGWECLY